MSDQGLRFLIGEGRSYNNSCKRGVQRICKRARPGEQFERYTIKADMAPLGNNPDFGFGSGGFGGARAGSREFSR